MRRAAWLVLAVLAVLLPGAARGQAAGTPQPPVVGVIVSGGSARGFAYLAILEELVAAGVPLDRVVGTSAGAIVGGLYGAGYSLETTGEILYAMTAADLTRVTFPPLRGILDPTGFEIVYRALVGNLKVQDTSPRLTVMATELRPGGARSLSAGDLAGAVRASMSLPGIFPVASFEGRDWVDGALRDPIPTDVAAAAGAKVVIAILPQDTPADTATLAGAVTGTLNALIGPGGLTPPDATIRVPFQGTLYLDFARARQFEAIGRQAAREALPGILALLRERGVPLTGGQDPHQANPINATWRERFRQGLEAYRSRPRPLTVAPALEAGPGAYDPTTLYGKPQADPSLAAGVTVGGGPLGVIEATAGAAFTPQFSVAPFLKVNVTPEAPWAFTLALDPLRRPAGNPFRVEGAFLPGPFRVALALDARAFEVNAAASYEGEVLTARATFTVRAGNPLLAQAPALNLATSAAVTLSPAPAWQARLYALAGWSLVGPAPFHLGAGTLQRAFPNDWLQAGRFAALSVEGAYRLDAPSVLSVASGVLDLHLFSDAALLDSGLLFDVGLGATFYGRWFGYAPFTIGTDAAVGNGSWRVNLYTLLPW